MQGPVATTVLQWKEHSGKTYAQMATEIGIDEKTLQQLAREEHDSTLRVIRKIARFFEWTTGEFGQALLWQIEKKPKRRGKRK